MVAYWTDELICEFANASYKDWFGKTPEQMHGIHLRELLGDELFRKNEPFITAVLGGERQKFERTLIKIDGSTKYTLANYIPDIVENRVMGFFVLVTDITEIKQAQHEVERLNKVLGEVNSNLASLSTTDGLTGIANRRHFDDVLIREYSRLARTKSELSLILLDIDHFKPFNDHYGHVSGDTCLQQIAAVIGKSVARSGDLAARYGGEEFVCILPDTDQQGALLIAERIRQGIINLAIPHDWSDIAACVTASLGVITVICHKEKAASEIIVRADALLYKAKHLGRNRIEYNEVSPEQPDVDFVQLVWQESFRLGNELIDDQHRNLFLNSNMLLHAIIESRTKDDTSKIISQLLGDITQHFIDEELILESVAYPLLRQHTLEHEKLKKRAFDLAEDYNSKGIHVGDVFEFLVYEVIKKHMLECDREYSAYMAG